MRSKQNEGFIYLATDLHAFTIKFRKKTHKEQPYPPNYK